MEKKVNTPKKGAGRRLSQKLEKMGQQTPPADLMKKINQKDEKQKRVAKPNTRHNKLEL